MTTIQIENFGETVQVRCNLQNGDSKIEINYMTGDGFVQSQFNCADARHTWGGLANIGAQLLAEACGEHYSHGDTTYQTSDVG